MKKRDIKSGMVLEDSDGMKLLVAEFNNNLICINNSVFEDLDEFNNDLTSIGSDDDDIVKIYKSKTMDPAEAFNSEFLKLIWDRKNEPINLTMQEIADKFNVSAEQIKIVK